jgi:hypothetical protein
MSKIDLLNPYEQYRSNYAHQIRHTIDAYSISMIVVGEALQNAIDAVCDDNPTNDQGIINMDINFDNNTISVTDNGKGFPPDISLLYLGGTGKINKNLKGKIGVGIKVSMFSSVYFSIKSHSSQRKWEIVIEDADKFENVPSLEIPEHLPEDKKPLESFGTKVTCQFARKEKESDLIDKFIQEIIETVTLGQLKGGFRGTASEGKTGFPSRFAALFSSFLRRYSYVGDVMQALGIHKKYPEKGIIINVDLHCTDAIERFGKEIGELFDSKTLQSFKIKPCYLGVEDTLQWIPNNKRSPRPFHEKLGDGGSNLERTDGFNIIVFSSSDEYESLLKNSRGNLPENILEFRKHLFQKINGIILTIGRIPDLEKFLPGGSRRVISCNGVVTSHEIDLTRGRNQEYVRCFDLVIDIDAELNYGKTHITNPHIVKLVRDFLNEAYVRTIQLAAGKWVGKIPDSSYDENDDFFVGRNNLELPNYIIQKKPYSENDVIALFFEMAGKGLFPDYRIYGLSQKETYDCMAAIRREKDEENILHPKDDKNLRVMEFKLHASDVMRDFDRYRKDARDIHVVIAWDEGDYQSKTYAIYDIDQSTAYQKSPKLVYPSVSKYIYDAKGGHEVQVILLQDVVNKLLSKK